MITNSLKKSAAVVAIAALLSFYTGPAAYAAGEITITSAVAGTDVLAQNGSSTVLGTFSPDLDLASSTSASLTASATSSTQAYYGVTVVTATSSPDVHWRIAVDHAADALTSGDVVVREVGTYNASSGQVRSSPATYTTTESSGNLILDGNISGWSIASGAEFTNIDEITFAADAPLGTYTITRSLINENGGEAFDSSFSFTVELLAAASSTPPTSTTTPPTSTSTPPTSTTTPPTASSSTAVITINGDNPTSVFSCNAYTDAGATAVDTAVATSSASSTLAVTTSSNVNLEQVGTYTVVYTATDNAGNTATSTRTVTVLNCSSGGGSSSRGISRAASVTPSASSIPGNAFGLNAIQTFGVAPGQVLGAFFPGIPATGVASDSALDMLLTTNLTLGSRGPEVAALQTRLFQTGYFKGPITGYYGPLTRNAVRAFQRAHGVSATGFFGPLTRAIFNS